MDSAFILSLIVVNSARGTRPLVQHIIQTCSVINQHNLGAYALSLLITFFLRLLALEPAKGGAEKDITVDEELKDEKHGIKMGVVSEKCDNGKVL